MIECLTNLMLLVMIVVVMLVCDNGDAGVGNNCGLLKGDHLGWDDGV